MINDWKYCIVQMPHSCFLSILCYTVQRAKRDRAQGDRLISFSYDQVKNSPTEIPKPTTSFCFKGKTKFAGSSIPSRLSSERLNWKTKSWSLESREVAFGKVSPVRPVHQTLFRFTAIGCFVPLYALVTVWGWRESPSGSWRTHPKSLEASALGANAYVAAPPCNQGCLLGQSVRQGFW